MNKDYASEMMRQMIWPDFLKHFKSDTTRGSYLSDINEFLGFVQKDFLGAGKRDIARYYDYLSEQVSSGRINPNTMAKKFRELHSFAAFICKNRKRYQIPDTFQDYYEPYLKGMAKQPALAKSMPVEYIDRLLVAAQDNLMAYCIFVLLYRAGLSSTEIAELIPEDFAAYDNGVYVRVRGRRELCFVPDDAVLVLEKYLAVRHGGKYLFYNSRGAKLNTMYMSRLMKKYTLKAGIPPHAAGTLRSACGFTMFAYGAEQRHVAGQLGVTVTQIRRYKGTAYQNSLQQKANSLVKVRVEPPSG